MFDGNSRLQIPNFPASLLPSFPNFAPPKPFTLLTHSFTLPIYSTLSLRLSPLHFRGQAHVPVKSTAASSFILAACTSMTLSTTSSSRPSTLTLGTPLSGDGRTAGISPSMVLSPSKPSGPCSITSSSPDTSSSRLLLSVSTTISSPFLKNKLMSGNLARLSSAAYTSSFGTLISLSAS